ncbi:hypothetical protein EDB84DRAFT_1675924 [Lactarius hengduanensis]|nr:hypothetical protein EDB84DRAFT_1675924 [Lactarius hengduanensis]
MGGWHSLLLVAVGPMEARLFRVHTVAGNSRLRNPARNYKGNVSRVIWFTWFTRSNLPSTPGAASGSYQGQPQVPDDKKIERAPSPASLYLSRPCPHPPTSSSRPQCLQFPSLLMKGQISRAPVSTLSRHGAPTVATVMESIRKIAFSVELFYHYPCFTTFAILIVAQSAPQEVVAEEDGGSGAEALRTTRHARRRLGPEIGDLQEWLPEDGSWEKERDATSSLARLHTCRGFTILAIKPRSYPDLAKRRLPRVVGRYARRGVSGWCKTAMGMTQYSNTVPLGSLRLEISACRRRNENTIEGGGTASAPTLIRLLTPPPLLLLGRADTVGAEVGAIDAGTGAARR